MSEASLASSTLPNGTPYFEQRLYGWSPVGTVATSAIIFAAFFGTYLAIAAIAGMSAMEWTGYGVAFHNGAWPALALALLIATALGTQRYARLGDASERQRYAAIFSGGDATAMRLTSYAPDDANLIRASLVGVAIGLLASLAILAGQRDARVAHPAVMAWFAVAITISAILFARGVELSRKAIASFSAIVNDELVIDLLRVDRLSVIGRSAARGALTWFLVSAVTCLFFIGGSIDLVSVAIMLACAAMGLWIFLGVMLQVHHKIITKKILEIEHVRGEIDRVRDAPSGEAATRLQGLLAYETRLEGAPEWPFDQFTLMRVGASALIVTVPWFGQAVAGYLIEHLAH
ncbi:MAG TPA: hypothetical protein VGG36_05180 [Rhizomicrobium sp.]